jgi:hypothetical protein
MARDKLFIFPEPKTLSEREGFADISAGFDISCGLPAQKAALYLRRSLQNRGIDCAGGGVKVVFLTDSTVAEQGYQIEIGRGAVLFRHKSECGAFYAAVTFLQILAQAGKNLPCLFIDDFPDFPNRGLMLDISRNKVPKLEILKKLADYLCAMKMNQFQLYIEGLSFFYEKHAELYINPSDFLLPEEVKELDAYCAQRCIELVPNQNSFGHMEAWLKKDKLAHLAECPGGFTYGPFVDAPAGTLNPLLPESADFVNGLSDDLLKCFTSAQYNIGGDEPFELGAGFSKEACESQGKGKVYLAFMQKIFDHAKRSGKRVMMWGDVLKELKEQCLEQFPKDVVALEWGYSGDSFNDEVCGLYKNAGIEYYVCPGTSLWNTVTGKTDNMAENIKNAARYGFKNGASGLLLTDWGDGGTCQQFACTLMPYAFGAACAWSAEGDAPESVKRYLNRCVFQAEKNDVGGLLADLGNYYSMADKDDFNATKIFKMLYVQQTDCMNLGENFEPLSGCRDFEMLSRREYENTLAYLEQCKNRLLPLAFGCGDSELLKRELRWSAEYLIHGCKLGILKTADRRLKETDIRSMADDIERLIGEYCSIWESRNKRGGQSLSTMRMRALHRKYRALLGD